ncbi:hypothetical protein NQ317_015966 [Molorchus minor]|uniref:Alpha-2-macroglobulin bait region domain-containing protein n=1 Tax=Molorchus minor TaxID=1323400 RepID=A0ABQ9JL56_9CUCU|nr:hypothetical protein NQ317_015966 [Molorchus minor]
MYKPGDRVKFRIFAIDEQLLPQNSKIKEIKIKNPLDITVAVWENVTPENGLVSLEYQMVTESITGKWRIECAGETKSFQILRYVLPRFQISLFYPRLIYYKTNLLNVTVCGHYSYGRPVRGLAFIKITDSHNIMTPIQKIKEMNNGCGEFTLTSEEHTFSKVKEKYPMYDPKIHIHITATVTEKGTSRIDMTTGKSLVFLKPYTMKIVGSSIFQPGLPYLAKIRFSNVQVNLSNEAFEVCYNLAIKKSWNYLNKEQCSNFSINEDNTVDFYILPMKSNVLHIHFNARSLNHTDIGDSFMAVRLYSPSTSYIFLEQRILEKNPDECRPPQQFAVYYTTNNLNENEIVTFYYMIKSRNQIFKLRKINHVVKKNISDYPNNLENVVGEMNKFTSTHAAVDSFIIKFKLDKRVGTNYALLVYYVTHAGETVALTKTIEIEPCLMEVDAKWLLKQVVPGAAATLNIKTKTHSLCSVSAIDKSTKFLSGNNQPKFDGYSLFKSFSGEREAPVSTRKSCVVPTRKYNQAASLFLNNENENTMWDLRRRKRHVYSFSEDYDSYDIFKVTYYF